MASDNINVPANTCTTKTKKPYCRSLSESRATKIVDEIETKISEMGHDKSKDCCALLDQLNTLDEKTQVNIKCYLKMGTICENMILDNEDIYLQIAIKLKDNKLKAISERLLLDRTDKDNCVDMFQMASTYELLELRSTSLELICENFDDICESSQIVSLGQKVIQELIESPLLRNLKSATKAVEFWYNYEKEPRKEYYETLVTFLRKNERFQPQETPNEKLLTYNVFFWFDQTSNSLCITVFNINKVIQKSTKLEDVCTGKGFAVCCLQTDAEEPPYVLISGGMKSLSTVLCCDVVEGTTKKLSKKLSNGRSFHCMRAVNKRVYVLGGIRDGSCIKTVNEMTSNNNNWSAWIEKGELLVPVYKASSCVYNNCIYLFGGLDEHGAKQKCVQKFDPASGQVTMEGELPVAICKSKALVANNKILIVSKEQKMIYYEPDTHESRLFEHPPSEKGKLSFFSDGKEYYFTCYSKKTNSQNCPQPVYRLDLAHGVWQQTSIGLKHKIRCDTSCRIDIPIEYQNMVPFF